MNAPTRPVLRWHGGKWKLAPWIISHFPKHRVYVEPFGGAASVLLRKERSYAEVYNDLDQDVVTLFRVLRDADASAALLAALKLTPFAKMEFEESYKPATDQIEVSRRLLIRSFMGFGSNGHNAATKTGFRANSNRIGTTPSRAWANYPDLLPTIIERLAGVVIETRDACEVMSAHDGAETLHYVDPPYMFETRSKSMHRNGCYAHEMNRGGACHPPEAPSHTRRHDHSLGLSGRTLRHIACRLAPRGNRSTRRWRPPAHRSPLAQSFMRIRPRSGSRSRNVVRRTKGANMTHKQIDLSKEKIAEARKRHASGEAMCRIAQSFNVKPDWLRCLIDPAFHKRRNETRRLARQRRRRASPEVVPETDLQSLANKRAVRADLAFIDAMTRSIRCGDEKVKIGTRKAPQTDNPHFIPHRSQGVLSIVGSSAQMCADFS